MKRLHIAVKATH